MSPGMVNGPSFTELPSEVRSNMEKFWNAACPLKKLVGRLDHGQELNRARGDMCPLASVFSRL